MLLFIVPTALLWVQRPCSALGASFDINVKVEYPKPKKNCIFAKRNFGANLVSLVFENLHFLPFPPVIG